MDPFCYMWFLFVCNTFLSVPCILEVTCLEGADFLALLYVMFFVFLSLSNMVTRVRFGT